MDKDNKQKEIIDNKAKDVSTKTEVKEATKSFSSTTNKVEQQRSSVSNKRNRIERKQNDQGKRSSRRKRGNEDGIDKRIVSIRRVARTYSGGKRMRLSVLVVAGDKKGRVGVGLGKGADVRVAEEKAFNSAKKSLVKIQLRGVTIPHEIVYKKGAAKIFMKPATPGTGVIAGGAMRAVLEMVGIKDILTKVIGTSNNISNVYASIEALQSLKKATNNQKLEK